MNSPLENSRFLRGCQMLVVIISADDTESVVCLRIAYAIFGDQIWRIDWIA